MIPIRQTLAALGALALTAPGLALAQEPPPAEEPTGTVRYDKGTVITSPKGDFELKIVGRLQARWELHRIDDGDDSTDEELTHFFSIPRARVTLEGHAFGDTDFKFQTEFGKGFVFLRDFYLDQPLAGFRLRVGQWKRPFSRQQITSSGSLQLVDRSVTDKFFGTGRDIGIAIHNNYEKSPEGLEWAVGIYNGTGDASRISCSGSGTNDPMTNLVDVDVSCKNPSNVPTDIGPVVVVRAGWNVGKIKGYSESDLEGGPLRLAAGVSYLGNLAEGDSDAMIHQVGADFILKVEGASLAGGAYMQNLNDETDFGLHVQGGYFFTPKRFEAVARFGLVPTAAASDDNVLEILGGFNWFAHGHSLKWQTDAGVQRTTTDPAVTELVVRTQAQLVF